MATKAPETWHSPRGCPPLSHTYSPPPPLARPWAGPSSVSLPTALPSSVPQTGHSARLIQDLPHHPSPMGLGVTLSGQRSGTDVAWGPHPLLPGYAPAGSLSTPHQQVPTHSPHWLCDLRPVAPPLCASQSPYLGDGKPRPCTRQGLWNHLGLALAPPTPCFCHPTSWTTLSSHSPLVWGPGPKQEGWDELSGERPQGRKQGLRVGPTAAQETR